jgi:hypothetical protein
MDLTEGSETSANINQTPGTHPKVDILKSVLSAMWHFYNHYSRFRFTYDVGIFNKTGKVNRLLRNTEARCWIHCCSGRKKTMNVTYYECAFFALVMRHVNFTSCIWHLMFLQLNRIFSHYLINSTIFGKESYWIISSTVHTKTQQSSPCTFGTIPCRYTFRPVTLTVTRKQKNASITNNAKERASHLNPFY